MFEALFGIPEDLAHEFEHVFHELGYIESTSWPERFVGAIRTGSDLRGVCSGFNAWRRMDGNYKPGNYLADRLILEVERAGADRECVEANPTSAPVEVG